MRSYLLGGAFGRRLDGDYAVAAALAAKAVGKPVKMVCTRPDDMRFDCPRSATTQVVRLAWADGNRVAAMDHHAAAGWPTATLAPYFQLKDAKGNLYDPFAIQGADHWYTVHLGDCPHRLRPGTSPQALRIPPHGGHPALRSTASGGFRSALDISSFRLRAISPDGTRVAYTDSDVAYVISMNGGTPRKLSDNAQAPDWSPDGNLLTVGSTVSGKRLGEQELQRQESLI
jgi:molybdopterin-binding aldehyde dehydrogenase-like protein